MASLWSSSVMCFLLDRSGAFCCPCGYQEMRWWNKHKKSFFRASTQDQMDFCNKTMIQWNATMVSLHKAPNMHITELITTFIKFTLLIKVWVNFQNVIVNFLICHIKTTALFSTTKCITSDSFIFFTFENGEKRINESVLYMSCLMKNLCQW